MAQNPDFYPLVIDLSQFKLHISLRGEAELTFHFNTPSRRFYLSVIAFIVNEMKRLGKVTSIPLEAHLGLLALLNDTVGGSAGSSEKENLLPRIYRKWQHALPNLEEAPLFKVLGKKKIYDEGTGKAYIFTEAEKDAWANLFEYKGSEKNVRLKFAIDKIGAGLDDVQIIYGDFLNGDAWERFISSLGDKAQVQPEKTVVSLPDKPSIAVLPFVNISGDQEHEYFSDGMGEDIITALSRIPDVFVIARNSSFAYKGKAVNVRQVGQELGARYVLEGSVRKVGDVVRITAQLIDATTGHHLWAERYDQNLKDIFVIQDEITLKILKGLQVKLGDGEQARLLVKGTGNIDAYLKMAEARSYFNRFERGSNLLARQLCEEAIALDPNWDLPCSNAGFTHYVDAMFGWSDSREQSVQKAFQLGQKALSLCESAIAHSLLAYIYTLAKAHDMAIEESKRSIALDPNSADAHACYAAALVYAGEPSKAIPLLEKAMRLNPFPPSMYFTILGAAHRQLGNVEKALEAYKKAIYKEPTNLIAHIGLAVCYFTSGQEEEARTQAQEILKIDPSFSVEYFEKTVPYKDRTITERLVYPLRKIGIK